MLIASGVTPKNLRQRAPTIDIGQSVSDRPPSIKTVTEIRKTVQGLAGDALRSARLDGHLAMRCQPQISTGLSVHVRSISFTDRAI